MADARSVRVLIVDNSPKWEDAVAASLRRSGNEVLTVFGGLFPRDEARDFAPELVMIHCGTAEFDGISLVKRFRRRQSFGSVPLVAFSSNGDPECRSAGIAAGFDQWLVKPLTITELTTILDDVRDTISMPGGLAQRTIKQVELFDTLKREQDMLGPKSMPD